MHEQKVILARLLRKYVLNFALMLTNVLTLVNFRRFNLSLDPNVKIEKKVSVVMKTQNGMPLKVTARSG
jgi:hypothetical protein